MASVIILLACYYCNDTIITSIFISHYLNNSTLQHDDLLMFTNLRQYLAFMLCQLILFKTMHIILPVVVVVCPLQPSSSVKSGCPGPESSILVSSRWACPISSHVTNHWGELRNRTGEVHPVDPFHSLDILKNHFASVAFCRNSGVYNVQNGAVIELSFVVSVKGFPRH